MKKNIFCFAVFFSAFALGIGSDKILRIFYPPVEDFAEIWEACGPKGHEETRYNGLGEYLEDGTREFSREKFDEKISNAVEIVEFTEGGLDSSGYPPNKIVLKELDYQQKERYSINYFRKKENGNYFLIFYTAPTLRLAEEIEAFDKKSSGK